MPKLRIACGKGSLTSSLMPLFHQAGVAIEGDGLVHSWDSRAGNSYFLLGTVIGIRQADGTLLPPSHVKMETARLENSDRIPEIEGRFVLVMVDATGLSEIWTDKFGRVDVYWQEVDGEILVATSLDLLPVAQGGAKADNVGVAHALTVYGSRPAKKHTLYKGVRRLGINEGLRVSKAGVEVLCREFKPASTVPTYGPQDLHRYADRFLEAIRARASIDGNVVYLSSGWDSTSILAALVHLFGNRKVRAVIGRMRYAERSGVINQFEIDRAKAVAAYFQIRLDIVELDYRTGAEATLDQLRDIFKSQQFANLAGVNHWKLAEATAKMVTGNEVIFAGEMSDGAHNLGFSQFTQRFFIRPHFEFREYSDKMASYLFGPTFLGAVAERVVMTKIPVWQLFKQRSGAPSLIHACERGRTAMYTAACWRASFFGVGACRCTH
jgi:hypothetical protein